MGGWMNFFRAVRRREHKLAPMTWVTAIGALIYTISPLDFIPDVLPVLGQMDDLGILVLSLKLFLRMSPSAAASFHADAITSGRRFTPMGPADIVIDATYRRE